MSMPATEPMPLPRRFYREATIAETEGGWQIALDGKTLKTPLKRPLIIASQALAEAVCAEWNGVGAHINPALMPLMRMLTIARDLVPDQRPLLEEELVRYASTDLLCYRDEGLHDEGAFRTRQEAAYTPVLEWAMSQGITLRVTQGIMPVSQPEVSLAAVARMANACRDEELAALALIVPELGSAVLALALRAGAISVEQAIACARLDDCLQEERYGLDPVVHAAWGDKTRDITAAAFVFIQFS